SVKLMKENGKKVVYDAEHFFDGYKDDSHFAKKMIKSAVRAGADVIVLCDTNGGTLPSEVKKFILEIKSELEIPLGIHTHNDAELAVANSVAAIEAGAVHVQGTINGVGERCGNANLCSIIPNIILKLKKETKQKINLEDLT